MFVSSRLGKIVFRFNNSMDVHKIGNTNHATIWNFSQCPHQTDSKMQRRKFCTIRKKNCELRYWFALRRTSSSSYRYTNWIFLIPTNRHYQRYLHGRTIHCRFLQRMLYIYANVIRSRNASVSSLLCFDDLPVDVRSVVFIHLCVSTKHYRRNTSMGVDHRNNPFEPIFPQLFVWTTTAVDAMQEKILGRSTSKHSVKTW